MDGERTYAYSCDRWNVCQASESRGDQHFLANACRLVTGSPGPESLNWVSWTLTFGVWIPVNSSNSQTPSDEACAAYLKAVADPTRLAIIRALRVGPLSVSDIAELLEHEIGAVSHHLRVLYHADIVLTRRDGKYIYYSLNDRILRSNECKSESVLDFGCCRLDVSDSTSA